MIASGGNINTGTEQFLSRFTGQANATSGILRICYYGSGAQCLTKARQTRLERGTPRSADYVAEKKKPHTKLPRLQHGVVARPQAA